MKTNRSAPSLIKIGIIGLGTVGSAVAETLQKQAKVVVSHADLQIEIKKVCDLYQRKINLPFTVDHYEIINDPEISVVVEAIGGVNPALKYILAAINQGKHVVTPNKEVIAKHMEEIFSAARKRKVAVLFEGAVGGGIPIIQSLREGLVGNQISEIYGIVNGTTNYILSKMTEEKMEFSTALKKAQEKGFAEANPKADLEGYDAQFKAAILAAATWGIKVDLNSIAREGITTITQEDIRYAGEIGYGVKLLAVVRRVNDKFDLRVHPALVNRHHPLASVSENFNAIYVKGKPIGEVMFYGPGAGGGPTASAIIADIVNIARHGEKAGGLKELVQGNILDAKEVVSRYYFHLKVPDRYGVLAQIAKVFAEEKVSIQAVLQKETVGRVATLVIILHEAKEKNICSARKKIEKLSVVKKVCNVIRIV